jgi:hypothetical protein
VLRSVCRAAPCRSAGAATKSRKQKAESRKCTTFRLSAFDFQLSQAIRDLGISAALTYLADQRPGSAPARPAPRMRTRSLFD